MKQITFALSREGEHVVAHVFAREGEIGRACGEVGPFGGSLNHDASWASGKGSFEQRFLIFAGFLEFMNELELLLYVGAFRALGEHRVEKHDVGCGVEIWQKLYAVTFNELHVRKRARRLVVLCAAHESIAHECRYGGIALHHSDAKARSGEQEGIFAKACGGIDYV